MIIKIDNEQAELIRRLGWLSSVGIVLVTCTFFGLIIGYYLDKWLNTAPWLTLVFLLFGMIAGCWNSFEIIMRCLKEPVHQDKQSILEKGNST
jgi:ATP synthase protein I